MFSSVPVTEGASTDGFLSVGLFALLEAAAPQKKRQGKCVWKDAQVAEKDLPVAPLASLPGVRKQTRVVSPHNVLQVLEQTLKKQEFEEILKDDAQRQSLQSLLERAGLSSEEAQETIRIQVEKMASGVEPVAPRRKRASQSSLKSVDVEQQTVMKAQLALLFEKDVQTLKMRCARVKGTWLFSRLDAIALMLDETSEEQVRMIWLRMQEDHPEMNGGSQSNSSGAVVTSSDDCSCTFQFAGERQRSTPVADIRGIVEMLLLVPGKRAANFRSKVASIFVRCVGGDPVLVQEIEQAAHVQKFLRQHCPDHPATAFGDAVNHNGHQFVPNEDQKMLTAHKKRLLDLEFEAAQKRHHKEIERLELENSKLEQEAKEAKAKTEVAVEVALVQKQKASDERFISNLDAWTRAETTNPLMKMTPADCVAVADKLRTIVLGNERTEPQLGTSVCLESFFCANEESRMRLARGVSSGSLCLRSGGSIILERNFLRNRSTLMATSSW